MTMTALAHSQRAFSALSPAQAERPAILLLTSSLLTDRTYLYTELLACLSRFSQVKIWATSMQNPRYQEAWAQAAAVVEAFPQVAPFREVPHNSLRRLNEFVWDFRLRAPSRLSMIQKVRNRATQAFRQAAQAVGRSDQRLAPITAPCVPAKVRNRPRSQPPTKSRGLSIACCNQEPRIRKCQAQSMKRSAANAKSVN